MGRSPEPSLEDIHLSDSFIEALSSGGSIAPQDSGDAALAALLGGWRDETRWPPDTGLISESQAIAALNAGLAAKPSRGIRERQDLPPATRHRRGLSVIGAAAAAALCLGGFGAVVNGSQPGDSLYGLRTMLFGTPKEVRDQKIGLAAKSELLKVQELIDQGDWQQAQEKLVAVSTQVAAVGDEQQKQELLTQFNDLSAKVVERDPEATAPPGVVYTVPPSAVDLVPVVAPPSDTATTTTTSGEATTTTPTTTTSGETTTTAAPTSTAPTTTAPTTTASGAATSATPTTTAVSTPAATSVTTSVSAPATTTAPAPASTTAPAATSSPAPAAATSAPATSTAASSASSTTVTTVTTTTAASAQSTQSVTTAAPTTTAAPVVTTTAVPVPVG